MKTGNQKTLLRPAKPEYDEGLLFARYIDEAAEGFFGFMLGRNSKSIIAKAFIETKHTLSYENVIFAEKDGKVVGMSSSFSGVQHREFSEEPLKKAASRSAVRMKIVRTLFSPLWRILESIPNDDFYIQGIAVEPKLRGEGIGSILMNDLESRARSNGSMRLSLDVSAKNKGAQKLYEKLGMAVLSKWPSTKILPPVFVRMSKDL